MFVPIKQKLLKYLIYILQFCDINKKKSEIIINKFGHYKSFEILILAFDK